METQTGIYAQVNKYLRKGSKFVDLRHLKVLSWMVTALLGSQSLNQNEWEPYVDSRAKQAQSYQKLRLYIHDFEICTIKCLY